MAKITVAVTCGGTVEPIDDVRAITNFSTGRFGRAIAEEFARQGGTVDLLCPRSTLDRLGPAKSVHHEFFTSAESLQALLHRRPAPTIIMHAAAVADYTPVKSEGKISSDQDELVIRMARTPKIISTLRSRFGKKTFIAGFKLLSGVSEAELIAAATKQMKANKLNMVVANDLQNIRDGLHPIIVCTAEGGTVRFDGKREDVARELVSFVMKRAQTHWFRSVPEDLQDDVDHSVFDATLSLAKDLNLLYDASGNVSSRIDGGLLVSPRQIDKSLLTPENAIYTQVDLESSTVRYAPISPTMPGAAARLEEAGELKPSIDTGMSAMLYDAYPEVQSLIHFHSGWGLMTSITRFPYPCGAREETEEIVAVQPAGNKLAAELIHHGFVVGLEMGDRERLALEWQLAKEDYRQHLVEVNEIGRLDESKLRPVWHGVSIVGVIMADPRGSSVYLLPQARGAGVGNKVVEQLRERGYCVVTVDDCNVRDYYKSKGFTESWNEEDATYLLTPTR